MIRFLLAVLFLFQLAYAGVAPQGDYLGKTATQVAAMGRQKWFEFYTAQKGESTLAMSSAEGLFGEALKAVNEAKLKRLSRTVKAEIASLRLSLTAIASDAVTLGRVRSGGGTIWNPVAAGITADVEEVVSQWLGNAPVQSEDTADQIEFLLSRLEMDLQAAEADIARDQESLGVSYPQAMVTFRRFRDNLRIAIGNTGKLNARQTAIMLKFAKKMAKRPFN